ncbi:HET-domain-containing protein [Parathielavia appendiculata]|uniref:HET-domain-containing protein n=1 Tax=Parathielavia appendiculata TaxID=2587402 RepID=A0AAN6TPA6_9PEZI|nr:HET-domain-containing protein [Parathielavia appendiculata]
MAAPETQRWTYRQLVQPIPPTPNLSTISSTPATPPCPTCRHLLLQDRSSIHGKTIPIEEFHITDTFPDFPILQAGCDLCRFLRTAIRSAWGNTGTHPMLESGVAPVVEDDDSHETLFTAPWDGRVKVHSARFRFAPFGGSFQGQQKFAWDEVAGSLEQGDGVVVGLTVEFGPASVPLGEEGEELVGELGTELRFKLFDSIDIESPVSASRRNLPSDSTLSERNVDLIKGWINGCAANHGNACQGDARWTPTRLLALDPLRLMETASIAAEDDHRYAALSYTRGNDWPDTAVQTSSENLDDRKEGIDLADLPRAFRDAIAVCQALGIRYLWIDALCILDDTEDWKREVVMMHKTFGHSEVTIAATSATSPQSSFLARNISAISAAKIGDDKRHVIFTPQEHETSGMRTSDVDGSPWNRDGWTLVERMLSARVIHFAKNKIYFECRRALRSEENDAESATPGPSISFWPRVEEQAADAEQYRPFLYQQWKAFLAQYTSRQLRRQAADKFLPVRAVAELMAAAINDEYLESAGMWRDDLAAQLLWYANNDSDGIRRMTRTRQAPTWSWIHCKAKIGFVRGTTDATLPPSLTKQRFRVADVLEPRTLSLYGYNRGISEIRPVDTAGDAWLAEMRKEYPWDLLVSGGNGDESQCVAHGALDDPDETMSAHTQLVYLHVTDEVYPTGLILARDPGLGPAWRRIGVATIFDLGDLIMDPPFQPDSFDQVFVE